VEKKEKNRVHLEQQVHLEPMARGTWEKKEKKRVHLEQQVHLEPMGGCI